MFAGNTAVWSQHLLSTVTMDNRIEHLTVFMRMNFVPLRGTHTNRWIEIEELLLQPQFHDLDMLHVHIVTNLDMEANSVLRFVVHEMEAMMPVLQSSGKLYVQLESDYDPSEDSDLEDREEM